MMQEDRDFTMTLFGEGILNEAPDIARVRIGVETTDMDLKKAQKENALQMQNVLRSITEMGIEEEDIQTSSYNIQKNIEYVDGQQVDKGYQVTNIVSIVVRDMSQIGSIVDTAVANGANLVQGITFEIEDPTEYYIDALDLALEDAVHKGEAIGQELRVRVSALPIQILEESYSASPYGQTYMSKSSTPIEPGQIQITAKIRALFTYR